MQPQPSLVPRPSTTTSLGLPSIGDVYIVPNSRVLNAVNLIMKPLHTMILVPVCSPDASGWQSPTPPAEHSPSSTESAAAEPGRQIRTAVKTHGRQLQTVARSGHAAVKTAAANLHSASHNQIGCALITELLPPIGAHQTCS